MKQFITDEEVERSLNYLRDTAKDFAKWKSRARYLDKHRKSVRAAEFLAVEKSETVGYKDAKAENSEAYKKILLEYEQAEYEFTLLESMRNAAATKIDAWRTIAATNRQGNI